MKQEVLVWNCHTHSETLYAFIQNLIDKNYHIDSISSVTEKSDIIMIIASKNTKPN